MSTTIWLTYLVNNIKEMDHGAVELHPCEPSCGSRSVRDARGGSVPASVRVMLVLRTSGLGTYRREEAMALDPSITITWTRTRVLRYPLSMGYTVTPVAEPVTFVY